MNITINLGRLIYDDIHRNGHQKQRLKRQKNYAVNTAKSYRTVVIKNLHAVVAVSAMFRSFWFADIA